MDVTTGTIKYAGPIGSANPDGFGIAYERELIGGRSVSTYDGLLSIPNALLFGSTDPTAEELKAGNGAIWYVVENNQHYKLVVPDGATSVTEIKWESLGGSLNVVEDFSIPD